VENELRIQNFAPQPALNVSLLSPDGQTKNIELVAAMRQLPKIRDLTGGRIFEYIRELQGEIDLTKMRYAELEGDILVLKLPEFIQSELSVDSMMKKARHKIALIIDLRGNPGGAVTTLDEVVANLFDHDVKICDRVTRDNSKLQKARTIGKNAFAGKLYVLVDSRSASASEVLARVVQSKSAVWSSETDPLVPSWRHVIILYGASITDADLIMDDGKSLEKVGVLPDETLLPVPADLAIGHDTVLARVVELAGGKITPQQAGKFFPVLWPSN